MEGKTRKRRKVSKACVYCRRSHLTCDDERPCSRCCKRGISGLCRDEAPKNSTKPSPKLQPPPNYFQPLQFNNQSGLNEANLFTQPQLDYDVPLFTKPMPFAPPMAQPYTSPMNVMINTPTIQTQLASPQQQLSIVDQSFLNVQSKAIKSPEECNEISCDPASVLPAQGLKQIIQAKFEAGLLKPFNYAQSYHELMNYMQQFNPTSTSRVLMSISNFKPFFRQVSAYQTDIDLILVEEKFEKLLIEYDRVLSCMGIPSACWYIVFI